MKIILASASPRRRELLERMGLTDFAVITADIDETPLPGLTSPQQVERLSLLKARAVAQKLSPDTLIIAADTVVTLDGAVLGKPADRNEARQMLSALSGREHQVFTGVTVLQGDKSLTRHEMTRVSFRPLTDREIDDYVSTGECDDKAGAYGIQGYGCLLVETIAGDYYNVMGLPVVCLDRMLKEFNINCLNFAARRHDL